MSATNTGGGAAVSGNAGIGRDIVGRDQIFISIINQYANAEKDYEKDRIQANQLIAQWRKIDPDAAEKRYRENLISQHNRLRIFGMSNEVTLQSVFADIYIFEEPLSRIPYDIEALRTEMVREFTRPMLRYRSAYRADGAQVVKEGDNLFILGKPGAGKTTFLKHLTVQAAHILATTSINDWQQYADELHKIMEQRNLIQSWQFTYNDIDGFFHYLTGNELLVQCLNVAVVSDRQVILAGLLAPPQVDEGRTE